MSYAIISEAQSKIVFTYDAAGNRKTREIVLGKSSAAISDSTSIIEPVSELMDEMKITIYPNPTQGKLSVEITNMPQDAAGEITIHDIEGKLMQKMKDLKTLSKLDLSTYPTGMFILSIRIGQKVSEWKIIKE